ncbi:hypothetical protein BDZ89DRAFT_648563 [Hymenopellis radicata]|nr:hypothetical protein BDZ89DRAFT_648563 [Hymenopellis radicata]
MNDGGREQVGYSAQKGSRSSRRACCPHRCFRCCRWARCPHCYPRHRGRRPGCRIPRPKHRVLLLVVLAVLIVVFMFWLLLSEQHPRRNAIHTPVSRCLSPDKESPIQTCLHKTWRNTN